jgi:hypothetical protein
VPVRTGPRPATLSAGLGVDSKTEAAIRASLRAGKGICSTARDAGVGVATVQRIKAEMVM